MNDHDHEQAMLDIRKQMQDVAMTPGANNEPVLAVNQLAGIVAKNGGYPLHMYHQKLDPVIALNRQQENFLSSKGYVRNHIPHNYPKALYRRNFDAKFAPEIDKATGKLVREPFVEVRRVKSEEEERAVKVGRPPKVCGPWVDKITDIEPIPEKSMEDPELKIAELEGQLKEARRLAETTRKV